ncbi:alkaline phosphatase family protein [Nonomuraea sp. NBC_01738]|uniref:alkaline phosphatase family protein n=1 Tax=Nonomuraea sp. NBC_01738 TaxID=2976003 RepID=UPI002E11783E|nr:alkaline phosphatase family protein [Nonomuraea sp. NBC_01738]
MIRWIAALLLAMSVMAPAAHADDEPVSAPAGISSDKVLVIGMDGLRHDRIAAADAPNLDSLMATGTFGTSLLYANPMAATSSGPGWSTIATGVWPDLHGVKDNSFTGKRYDLYPDFLTRLENLNGAYSTYAALDWKPLADQGTFSSRIDTRYILDGDANGYSGQDALIAANAETVLRDQNPDAAFVYFGNTDIVAHNSGATSNAYLQAIATIDGYIGRLLSAIRARPTYGSERWTIVAATDHGHADAGGHGGSSIEERRTFVLASGPGIAAGARPADTRLVDVTATVFGALGLAAPGGIDSRKISSRTGDPFEPVALSGRLDETGIPNGVLGYGHTPPAGWALNTSAMPTGGVREWRGWAFTTDEFWSRAQRDQWRELNVRARGTFAVADSDEWDDKSHGTGPYDSTLTTPGYAVGGRSSVTLGYSTLYRPDGAQKAQVLVSFDGGADVLVKNYTAETVAKQESLAVAVPAGASSMKVKFRYFDATNNWYWAIDNVTVS